MHIGQNYNNLVSSQQEFLRNVSKNIKCVFFWILYLYKILEILHENIVVWIFIEGDIKLIKTDFLPCDYQKKSVESHFRFFHRQSKTLFSSKYYY